MTKVVKLFGKHNLRPRENCHKIIWSRSDNSKNKDINLYISYLHKT